MLFRPTRGLIRVPTRPSPACGRPWPSGRQPVGRGVSPPRGLSPGPAWLARSAVPAAAAPRPRSLILVGASGQLVLLDSSQGVCVGTLQGGPYALIAGVDVLRPDQLSDAVHPELLPDMLTGRDDDELAVPGDEGLGVAVQYVDERGTEVGAPPQPQDHHRIGRPVADGRSCASSCGAAAKDRLP